jgi:ATP-dependent helicase/DNAse subunit B
MFKVMKKHVPALKDKIIPEWKSKSGLLSESDRERLDQFMQD